MQTIRPILAPQSSFNERIFRWMLFGTVLLSVAGALPASAVPQSKRPPAPTAPESSTRTPVSGEAEAQSVATLNIREYRIAGAKRLTQQEIGEAVYPFLGPLRTEQDVEGARAALQAMYHEKGFQTVTVEVPPQSGRGGVVFLKVLENKVGRLRIIEERRVPISLIITDSGEMEVPLIGRVAAKGKTCKQLAHELKPILEKEYFYKATVIIGVDNIRLRSRGRVYITGQVRNVGGVEILPDEPLTVSKAILRNGGLGEFANPRKVKLVRKKADGTSETRIIDLAEILDKGRLEKDVVLEAGDLINVPERLF